MFGLQQLHAIAIWTKDHSQAGSYSHVYSASSLFPCSTLMLPAQLAVGAPAATVCPVPLQRWTVLVAKGLSLCSRRADHASL
jgi:hypothetical protein